MAAVVIAAAAAASIRTGAPRVHRPSFQVRAHTTMKWADGTSDWIQHQHSRVDVSEAKAEWLARLNAPTWGAGRHFYTNPAASPPSAPPVRKTPSPVERALLPLAPSPKISPREVVEIQCAALQRGGNEDIEHMWRFVAPDGPLAVAHQSSAGAMARFRWTVRKEPRWRNIASRPHAALLSMRSWDMLGCVMIDADVVQCRVRASPCFPDALHAESEVSFLWTLVKQRALHPETAEALGATRDCWMVHDIAADYASWHVHDPLNAERAPDFFPAHLFGP